MSGSNIDGAVLAQEHSFGSLHWEHTYNWPSSPVRVKRHGLASLRYPKGLQ